MFSLVRSPVTAAAGVALLGCGLLAGCGSAKGGAAPQPAQAGTSGRTAARQPAAAGQPAKPAAARPARPAPAGFAAPVNVDNPMFPLVTGTEFTYRGKVVEGGVARQHSVVFTVTDVSKTIGGVRTVVAWDRDFLKGRLQEQELALFAQDDNGTVWNFGEYPEEYSRGRFQGAPSTWIRGIAGAYGGVHMLARPVVGARYYEGLVKAIEFDDVSRVASTSKAACVPTGCYHRVLVVDETSPNDPASGHQIKYYAAGLGLIRVGARGGDSQEFLALTSVRHLGPEALAKARAAVLRMDRRAYRVSKVYRATPPAQRRGD
jgi:hypothetical protein